MASTIITKNSSTAGAVPLAANLTQGELAINTTDRRLYTKDATGTVVEVGSGTAIVYRENFSGNDVTTVFTMAHTPVNEDLVDIYINGIYQNKDTFSVSTNVITFTEAPVSGTDNIEVMIWQSAPIGSTDANYVSYTPAGTGAVATTVQTKLRETVSVKDFGAVGDGVADDTAAINAAIAASKAVYFPNGTYLISSTIGDWGANPIARTLYGESQEHTIIKSAPSWGAGGMVWFGNSTGYGAQYCTVRNLTIDGHNLVNNHSGIVYQSAGLSLVQNVTIQNCGRAAWMHGCIDTAMIDCNIFSCFEGAWWDVYPIGTPSSAQDMTVQALQTTRANISRMYGCWISGCEATSVYISGGSFLLDACTFQSTTNNALYNIIHIEDSNESYDYGGGPIIQNCWQEGGAYKYAIYVENTRQTRIFNNHLNGDFGAGTNVEGAICLDAASIKNVSIKNNSIRGNYAATPTNGRLANAAIYIPNATYSYTADIENNYITTNSVNVYWEGQTSPTVDRRVLPLYASVSISGTTPTLDFQSANFITSVTRNGVGDYTLTYRFNRQALAAGKYPVLVTPATNGGGNMYACSVLSSNTGNDRIQFFTVGTGGALADPAGFTIMLLGGGWQQI
jgi:hypothetical protein